VTIASGYGAHPLDGAVNDRRFLIRGPGAPQACGTTPATLNNMTSVQPLGPDADNADTRETYHPTAENPPHLREKALSPPTIFDGQILLSTYAPTVQDADGNPCAVRYGSAYVHTVDLRTGAPASLTGEAPASRSEGLSQPTPPPTPTLLVNEDGERIVVIGTEVLGEGDFGNPDLRRHRWMQLPRDEANAIKAHNANDGE